VLEEGSGASRRGSRRLERSWADMDSLVFVRSHEMDCQLSIHLHSAVVFDHQQTGVRVEVQS
jgi:hypothetical protein